ncbi:MAG: hypothetical protein SOT33_01625, partial [Acidaminococcus fermentans]
RKTYLFSFQFFVVVEVKCSLDMSLFYRKTRGLVNRSVHKTPTFIIEPIFLYPGAVRYNKAVVSMEKKNEM